MFYSVFKKLQCKIDLEQVDLCFFFISPAEII